MAPFGKAHAAVHGAADRVKSGILWAHHRYQQGVGLAGKVNDMFNTGKKIAGLMMPVLDRVHPAIAPHVNAGLGAMDQLRDMGIQKHDDVLNKIRANADVLDRLREAKALAQPYMA